MIRVPDHEILAELRRVDGQRLVLRTRAPGLGECTTRLILSERVDPRYASTVRNIACHGRGSVPGLAESVALMLEGHKVAAALPTTLGTGVALAERSLPAGPPSAQEWSWRTPEYDERPRSWDAPPDADGFGGLRWSRLPADARWTWRTEAVDAGVTPDGFVYVSTRYIPGTPVSALGEATRRGVGVAVAWNVALVLAELHVHNVAYGDLKAENLVLTPTGRVVLIDLDTLREVGGPGVPSRTRDATRAWAAPEQLQSQETYLASDTWAYARLLETLFPGGGLPPELLEVWRACRRTDPLQRPNTRSLLARMSALWLAGLEAETRFGLDAALGDVPLLDWRGAPTPPDDDATAPAVAEPTERVEEAPPSDATDRVDDTPPRPVEMPPPLKLQERRGCGRWAALLGCGGVVVAGVASMIGYLAWESHRAAEADATADALLAELKVHKTDRTQNTSTVIAAIRARADAAYEEAHTPRTCSVRALATVWDDGWHRDPSFKTAATTYEADRQLVVGHECEDQLELLLARATVATYACLNRDAPNPSFADCTFALDALSALQEAIPDEEGWRWFQVEALWQEARVRRTLAKRYADTGNAELTSMLAAGNAVCDHAVTIAGFAPVNGPELFESCLPIAGVAGDVDHYLAWSAAMLAAPLPTETTSRRNRLQHLYRDWGNECAKASLTRKKGQWNVEGPPWCVAIGHLARGCVADALTEMWTLTPDADAAHPWSALQAHATSAPATTVCIQ